MQNSKPRDLEPKAVKDPTTDHFFEAFESVRRHTIHSNSGDVKRTIQIIKAILLWADFLNRKQIIGDPKFRLFIQTGVDIDASRALALRSYYRQAIMILRSWLEVYLLNIYFIDHPVELDWWLNSIEWKDRPDFGKLVDYVYKLPQFRGKTFPGKYRNQLNTLYGKLSKAIHGRGPLGIDRGLGANFHQGLFKAWINYLSETFRLTSLISFKRFWDDARQDTTFVRDIKATLDEHLIEELQQLAISLDQM